MNSEKTVSYLHIARNPDDQSRPIILNVPAPFPCLELLQHFLGTDKLHTERKDFEDGTGFLFIFGKEWKKPYPSVIVYAYNMVNGACVVHDFGQKDLRIIPYAISTYLEG